MLGVLGGPYNVHTTQHNTTTHGRTFLSLFSPLGLLLLVLIFSRFPTRRYAIVAYVYMRQEHVPFSTLFHFKVVDV